MSSAMRFAKRGNELWVEGLAIRFNDPQSENWADQRDLYETVFDKNTDFMLDAYPIEGKPLLFNHGYDEVIGAKPIGIIMRSELRDDGLWIEARLRELDQYVAMVKELDRRALMKAGRGLGFSIAALSAGFRVSPTTGHVDVWPIAETSLTHVPGDVRNQIQRSEYRFYNTSVVGDQLLTDIETSSGSNAVVEYCQDVDPPVSPKDSLMKPNLEIIQGLASRLATEITQTLAQLTVSDGAIPAYTPDDVTRSATAVLSAVELPESVAAEPQAIAAAVEAYISANGDTLFGEVIEGALRASQTRRTQIEQAARAAMQTVRPNVPVTDNAPAFTGNPDTTQRSTGRITGVADLRYDHLNAEEMLLGANIMLGRMRSHERVYSKLGDSKLSETYLRAMMMKAADSRTSPAFKDGGAGAAFRSAIGLRADEIGSTQLSGYGAEFVGTAYGTTVWETVRFEPGLYALLRQKGLDEVIVPEGSSTFVMPVEGSDPTAYNVLQVNDFNAVNQPDNAFTSSKVGTANSTMTLGALGIKTMYSLILQEDSVVAVLPQYATQMRKVFEETIESVLINGDTVLTANTNINLIDGTPTTQAYTIMDGMRKTALSNGVDATASYQQNLWMKTLQKLPGAAYQRRKQNVLYVIDLNTHQMVTLYPKLIVANPSASEMDMFRTGDIDPNTGVSVYTSGFMALSNGTGKISATAGNNLYGTILAAYAPYWRAAFRRAITFESEYKPNSQVSELYMHARFGIKARGSTAAAAAYDISVEAPLG